jgi:hypothetical protein
MRALVSMPRSPTSINRCRPKRSRSLRTCAATVLGSAVLPGNTSTAMGHPSALVSKPQTIGLPLRSSREWPKRASGQR